MLIVTLGDPASVNIELIDKCLDHARVDSYPVVLIGSRWQWRNQIDRLGRAPKDFRFISNLFEAEAGIANFLDLNLEDVMAPAETLEPGQRGRLAAMSLSQLAGFQPKSGHLAVLTAPTDKSALFQAGFTWSGQTEFFEALWRAPAIMTLAGPKLRVGLVTNHLPISNVTSAVTRDQVVRKLALLARTLRDVFGVNKPRIAVCGINPHCGEQGMFGDDDMDVIVPAVRDFNEVIGGKIAVGPLPADSVFHFAYQGKYDAVLAMYHDQGLAPLKTVHFYDAVNVSGGLPHLRVSPDHGTARDLFLKGKASHLSVASAWRLADEYLLARLK